MATTPDYLRRAEWCCLVVWLLSAVGVVLALVRGDWLTAVYAVLATGAAAGWLIAVRQWAVWRALAEQSTELLTRLRADWPPDPWDD